MQSMSWQLQIFRIQQRGKFLGTVLIVHSLFGYHNIVHVLVFQDIIVVSRVAKTLYKCCKEVQHELGSGKDVHVVIPNLGGQLAVWKLEKNTIILTE